MGTNTPSNPERYLAVRDELIATLSAVDDETAALRVPACPQWSVKDVAAHLCGLNAELLAKVPGRLGTDEATTRQVGDRSHDDLAAVLAEWTSYTEPIAAALTANDTMAQALLADLVIHVGDLAEVLHQPVDEAAAATPGAAARYVPLLQERLATEMHIALTVELSDGGTWPPPANPAASLGEPATTAITVATDAHSFLRGVSGRLRRTDVEAFSWSADPGAILDNAWNQYGPFRI